MSINILIIMSTMINIMMTKTMSPMVMVLMIISQTFMVMAMSGMMMESFWLSYIMMMIILGGMMVLFIYITSVASNEKIYIKISMIMMLTAMFLMLTFSLDKSMTNIEMINSEMLNSSKTIMFKETKYSMKKLFNMPNMIMTITIMVYLMITLIVLMKIMKNNYGPIRSMTYE
uniref:NADH dehydrogenase subunit 6 n=1 Tax=China mantispoides TaxID=3034372 RepID=UPI002411820B|nr:NADH dehydrogenase subunit 6 [China mantispoides]WEL32774.1 NADH dehydrogenase subunit 6 [China mantispoides]